MAVDKKEADKQAVLKAIADMPEQDRQIGDRLHEIITTNAPELLPRTWYGMPAYSNSGGKIICFFRSREKFGEHYMTFGFNDSAKVDDGTMWPTAYALTELSEANAKNIAELVKKAVS